jgi:hypothetical protein
MFWRSEDRKAIRAAMRDADQRANARNATLAESEQASAKWHQLHDQEPDVDYYREHYGKYAPDWIPRPDEASPRAWRRYDASRPGSRKHKAAYMAMHREAKGRGFPGPDPEESYRADHGYDTVPEPDDYAEPEDAIPRYASGLSAAWTGDTQAATEMDERFGLVPDADHDLEPGA